MERAVAGDIVGLSLRGVTLPEVARGDVLVAPAAAGTPSPPPPPLPVTTREREMVRSCYGYPGYGTEPSCCILVTPALLMPQSDSAWSLCPV